MLKQRPLAMLWISQVLSAIGDQLHSLAVLWISVQIGGAKAGFVAAAGTLAGLLVGLVAGVYADRWNRRRAMIVVDLLRAVVVLGLAIVAQVSALQLWQMALVAVIVSALGTLFNPCMAASLPCLTEDPEILRAMTALMIGTFRIARLIGPAIASIILAFLPIHTFFFIDSASYVVSAWAIWALGSGYVWRPEKLPASTGVAGVVSDLLVSARLAARDRQLTVGLALSFFDACFWCAAYIVGLPLMLKQAAMGAAASNVTAYATVICAYGFGNVVSNLIVGTMDLKRRAGLYSGVGVTVMGSGFLLLGAATNLPFACTAAAFAATGGPLIDLATVGLVQEFPDEFRGKLNALRGFLGGLGSAIGLSLAPLIFSTTGGATGVVISAIGLLATGVPCILLGMIADRQTLLHNFDRSLG